ncbi:MAG: heme o synthase [Fuerstiella sp.]|nr:heme o synthase [Fuerstiella sp.]
MSIATPAQTPVVRADRVGAQSLVDRTSDYVEMCRPRIAVMTMAAVSAGFILASPIIIHWGLLAVTLAGILLLVAASSILNQVLEVRTDARMQRTTGRPLISGRISRLEASLAGLLFALSGIGILWSFTNPVTTVAGAGTLLCYVLAYTPLKIRSSLCTTVGALPGAMPPVIGWLAAGGAAGSGAWSLFALLFTWQFPHFLAIGWIYRHEYEQAGLRMLPSFSDGGRRTGIVATIYAAAFVPVSLLPSYAGLTGRLYFAVALALSGLYFAATLRFALNRTTRRGRDLLLVSLLILPALLLVMVCEFLYLTALG